MPGKQGRVVTQVPIIGDYSNFKDAITELINRLIVPTFNQIGTELGMLSARIEVMEQASKSVNVFINPSEIKKIFEVKNEEINAHK